MTQIFYEIEFLNDSIHIHGKEFARSVRVVETIGAKKISEHYLGLLELEEIYRKIDKGVPIDYERVYVKNFSMTEYRRSRVIGVEDYVPIPSFTFRDSLFDCESVDDFARCEFKEGVQFNRCAFTHGTLDFRYCRFGGELTDFSDCRYQSHQTIFQYAHFESKETRFDNSSFDGRLLSFINAVFKSERVSFKRCNFNQSKVKFHFAEFGEGTKSFEKIRFDGPVLDFRRVYFGKGKIDFRRSLMGSGHVTFEESEIKEGKITFRLSRFEGGDISFRRMQFGPGEANFDHIDFGCRSISFENASGDIISICNSNVRSSLDLRVKMANTINLSFSHLHSITDLSFMKKDGLQKLLLKEVRNLGKIIIDWNKNNVQTLVESQDTTLQEKADQFNVLKDNFSKNGQYRDEDWAYVYFKRYEHQSNRKKYLEQYKSFAPFVRLLYACRKLIFDHMGLFATSPNRVLLSMVVTIVLFALGYIALFAAGAGEIINSVDASDQLDIFDKSLYHSAITFFTIGYGDYYPTSFSRALSAVEGWVGVFMMSYFTVAFVRKILR